MHELLTSTLKEAAAATAEDDGDNDGDKISDDVDDGTRVRSTLSVTKPQAQAGPVRLSKVKKDYAITD